MAKLLVKIPKDMVWVNKVNIVKNKQQILSRVEQLLNAYNRGILGGEKMPEHENPGLNIASKENYLYFTLPMALNYQRNSYVLWECANRMYNDFPDVYDCKKVTDMPDDELKNILVKYKVALQPNKQPEIWKILCNTFMQEFNGDIREFFKSMNYEVRQIKLYIQQNKKKFPYLGGNKINNYWLYVMEQYTDVVFKDRENITVAPDTHVIQASAKLGVITNEESSLANVQEIVAARWKELLKETEHVPIDIHTPMWLWSRGKFKVEL
ncbi:MAG: hypothetical protein HDR27_01100 [Lachnospiraceae bacterium]|nr:hypothetical protein [Lachnospiraceae bacterium]